MSKTIEQHVKIQTFDEIVVGNMTYRVQCYSLPGRMAHKLTAEIVGPSGEVHRSKHFQLGTTLISNSEQLRKAKNTIDQWSKETPSA